MQVLVIVRTVFIRLVGVSACLALSSSAGQGEEPDTNSRSVMTTISAKNSSIAIEESNVNIDKNNESRTLSGARVSERISKELSDASLALGHTPFSARTFISDRNTKAIERFVAVTPPEVISMINKVAIVLRMAKWRNVIEAMDISWEVEIIRKLVLAHCLKARESPAHTFRYMRVDLMHFSADTQKYDPKLFWWFDYVEKYRQRVGVEGLIPTAKSDAATKYEKFDDEELFAFLINEYDLQTEIASWTAVDSPKMTPLDSRQHVVALSEWLRHQPGIKKLAEGMQLYMVSMWNTEQLVLREWVQGGVSPKIVFDILRVGSYDDSGMFPLWLKYIEMYWNNVFSGSDEHYFYYDVFLSFLAKKSSWNDVKKLLYSELFYQIFDKAPQLGFGTHAKNLQAMLVRWHWLHSGASPHDFFRNLGLSRKFEIGDLEFLQGILYVDLYRAEKRFTNKELFNLLSEKNSVKEIVGMFEWLQEYWGVEEITNDMLRYLTQPSMRKYPHVTQTLQRKEYLPKKKHKGNPSSSLKRSRHRGERS